MYVFYCLFGTAYKLLNGVLLPVSEKKWLVAHPDFIQRDAVQTDSEITQFRRVRVVEVTQDSFYSALVVSSHGWVFPASTF